MGQCFKTCVPPIISLLLENIINSTLFNLYVPTNDKKFSRGSANLKRVEKHCSGPSSPI